MDIKVLSQDQSDSRLAGGITLEVVLDMEDLSELEAQAARALEIERKLPAEARTAFGNAEDAVYASRFIETRATNDALEVYGIIPVAAPRVHSKGLASGELYTCTVHVVPRPHIGLTSLDPVDLETRRVAKPGFSAKEAAAGGEGVEFVDDEKVLRHAMIDRLDSELPDNAIRALADEYQANFERELFARNIDPESYQLAHGLNEEQYLLMMARRALNDAHWNYVLDAVFVGVGLDFTEDDLRAGFEGEHPGCGEELMELYELRGELWKMVEKVRRAKALTWLRENTLS